MVCGWLHPRALCGKVKFATLAHATVNHLANNIPAASEGYGPDSEVTVLLYD